MTAAVKYPHVTVKLIGEDGNAYAIIGAVKRALAREVSMEAAQAFVDHATSRRSYHELLAFVMETVDVD